MLSLSPSLQLSLSLLPFLSSAAVDDVSVDCGTIQVFHYLHRTLVGLIAHKTKATTPRKNNTREKTI